MKFEKFISLTWNVIWILIVPEIRGKLNVCLVDKLFQMSKQGQFTNIERNNQFS